MRLWKAIKAAVSEAGRFLPRLWGLATELFHEVMGFVFFAFALFFLFGAHGAVQSFRNLKESPDELPLFLATVFVAALLTGFGFSSFRRARRGSRRRREQTEA
jgi:branched-subunit amino acid ABC-type transport system permease component